jgi:hypothetical protein
MEITATPADPEVEEALRRLQYTPEERARLFRRTGPFSFEEWQREARPATAEELADWEEFVRQREAEREASLASEAGLAP